MPTTKTEVAVHIPKPKVALYDVCIVGTTPFICNRMSEKAKRELLLPKGRKTAADKAAMLKHNPIEEFRSSPYTFSNSDADTYVAMHGAAPRRAMANAALEVSGASKSGIARQVSIPEALIPLYGKPWLSMMIVRSADMNKTPDVRTRALIWPWAARFTVKFVEPQMNEQSIANLLATAGVMIGVGDGRPEKGALSYGQFEVCGPTDDRFLEIERNGSRGDQIAAFESPEPHDDETEELLTWFDTEIDRRGDVAKLAAV